MTEPITEITHLLQRKHKGSFGFAQLQTPLSLHLYEEWLKEERHGDMEYLRTHLPLKKEPEKLLPRAQSAIVLTHSYASPSHPEESPRITESLVARYARQQDYHFFFQEHLVRLSKRLKELYSEEEFLPMADSSPVLERDLAQRAGLGWVGKNSCLIDRKEGSFFFIGEIYTSLGLENSQDTTPDHCGTCRRCIDACPTDALLENRTMDATKCISYWNIESQKVAPEELRSQFGSWFFGCDICQEVCPWNKTHLGEQKSYHTESLVEELRWVLTTSNKKLMQALKDSPLSRSRGRGLKRNAMTVATNKKLYDLAPVIETYIEDPYFKDLARWSIAQLQTRA